MNKINFLASGMPMLTDVKYKDRCDIKICILYTCSNYPTLEMYCKVPSAKEVINEQTNTIRFTKQLQSMQRYHHRFGKNC
uniref:Uncharacterized protein n=1 Tax=Pararge aegeria TaxID=116150 RepID=S4PEN1_9NEOP